MASLPLEEVLRGCPKVQQQQEVRPQPEQPLKCPRCESTNTKFCYYNNYSLSQPRYFCKGCRRYWTKGGTLRNVPVGGGCRKNKKPSSSSSSKRPQDQAFHTHSKTPPLSAATIIPPLLAYDPNELASAFARLQEPHHNQGHLLENHETFLLGNPNHKPAGFLDGTTDHSDFHNLYCGYGGNSNVYGDRVLPFDGGLSGEETAAATSVSTSQVSGKTLDGEEGKALVGVQWQDGGDFNISLDSYCNGGVQLGIDSSTAPLCNR